MNKKYTREELQQYAKEKFCLNKLAKNWENIFFNLIEDVKTNPIPPYQPTTPYRGNGKGYSSGDTRLAESDPRRNQLKSMDAPAATKNKPTISIMVPTMRVGGLDVLLESLKHQTFKDFELVIVDGIYKYRKSLVEKIKSNYDFPIIHVEPTKNTFPIGCCCNSSNTGIINCSADLLLIITDYTYLPANCVEKHVKFHTDNPQENLGYMCPHQYKLVPELNPNFVTYKNPLMDAQLYAADLESGKLNEFLFSTFKEPFSQDPENLPLDSMGNADTKLFMTAGPADQNAFNGKNESLKISAALKINGYDEDLDGTHCWQDNVFSDMLVKKLGFTWIVDPNNKVYIVNPRHITPWSKRMRTYQTNKGIWERKRDSGYPNQANSWNLAEARDAILNDGPSEIKLNSVKPLQKISVIVTTNRIGGLDVLFESLKNQSYQNFELILVDAIYQKRKGLVAEKSKKYNFTVKHVEPIKNIFPVSNYCSSMNTGLCMAEGELAYFTCDYACLDKDTLLTHAKFHANNADNYALLLPVNYYGLDKDVMSESFPQNRQYGQKRRDSKYNLLVATEKDYVDAHDQWTDTYVTDLQTDLLDNLLWSTFKQPFNNYSNVESYSDFNMENTNIDIRYENTEGLVLEDMCCLKNDSFKLKFLLNANGFDEAFDGTHGFQDTGLARRLHSVHGAIFSAANKAAVKVLNIRFYLEPRKIINGYRNIDIINHYAAAGYIDPINNTVSRFKELNE
jgi:glycosyltransferase involved in cell wall biosynthesis